MTAYFRRLCVLPLLLLGTALILGGCGGGSSTSGNTDSNTPTPMTPENPETPSGQNAPQFNLQRRTVTLNSGYEMPILGIGTYNLSSTQAENSVYWALKAGFRLIDTARIYGNEDGVGRGIRRAIGLFKRRRSH